MGRNPIFVNNLELERLVNEGVKSNKEIGKILRVSRTTIDRRRKAMKVN